MHFKHDLTFNLNNEGDYDFEYSDIGFCQEESLVSPDIPANQLLVVTSGITTANQDSEKIEMNTFQSRFKLNKSEE